MRFLRAPSLGVTALTVLTWLSALLCCKTLTAPAPMTVAEQCRRSGMRFEPTRPDSRITRLVSRRFRVTPLLSRTLPLAIRRCSAAPPGGGDTAVGAFALSDNTTGITNTPLGFNAGFGVTMADNVIVIGTNVGGQNIDHSCFIGEI